MPNRFELLESIKTDFGTGGQVLGAWTKKDGTVITAAAGDDVLEADVDAGKGVDGTGLLRRETVGPAGQKVRVFQLAYLDFEGTDAAKKISAGIYVTDWGEATEAAYWLNAKPALRTTPMVTLQADLNAYVEGLVGSAPPSPFTGDAVHGFVMGAPSSDRTCFEVDLFIDQTGNVIKKEPAIICLESTGPNVFSTNKPG